jgi:hypothetical protein
MVYIASGREGLLTPTALRTSDKDMQVVAAHRDPWTHCSIFVLCCHNVGHRVAFIAQKRLRRDHAWILQRMEKRPLGRFVTHQKRSCQKSALPFGALPGASCAIDFAESKRKDSPTILYGSSTRPPG